MISRNPLWFLQLGSKLAKTSLLFIIAHGDALLAKIRKVAESMCSAPYPIDANADKRAVALRQSHIFASAIHRRTIKGMFSQIAGSDTEKQLRRLSASRSPTYV
ncbi:hypothetical protein IW262DRAFT_553022 [Armillaria fumosa]|nr:hypothetical protein IW262DRAFT_553022 [Armillaria fumosa]